MILVHLPSIRAERHETQMRARFKALFDAITNETKAAADLSLSKKISIIRQSNVMALDKALTLCRHQLYGFSGAAQTLGVMAVRALDRMKQIKEWQAELFL